MEKIAIKPELDNTEITLDVGVFWKKDEQNSMCQFIARPISGVQLASAALPTLLQDYITEYWDSWRCREEP